MFNKKIKYCLLCLIFFLSSCSYSKEEQEIINNALKIDETIETSTPLKLGEDLSLQGKEIEWTLLYSDQFKEKLEAKEFYVCEKKRYLIPNTDYCIYFKDFYFISKKTENDNFYIVSEQAFSNNKLENFLFYNMRIILANYPYILVTSEATLYRTKNLLVNNYDNTLNQFKGIKEDFSIEGYNLKIDYNKNSIELTNSSIELDDLGGL